MSSEASVTEMSYVRESGFSQRHCGLATRIRATDDDDGCRLIGYA